MNSSSVRRVVWSDSREYAGQISVSLADGSISFVSGPADLRKAVRDCLGNGVLAPDAGATVRSVDISDEDFEIHLSWTLSHSGFELE